MALPAIALLAAGCGAGTAALVSGGSDVGSGNAPPVLTGFAVESTKTSPARIRFTLSDREANPAVLELGYSVMDGPVQLLTQLVRAGSTAATANPATLATTSGGIEHALDWDFTAEPAPPSDGSFVDDVRVIAILQGGVQKAVLGANGELGVGNDAPRILPPRVPNIEVSGIVGIEFAIADSSDDVVSVRVEYDVVSDVPDLGWRLARPALADSTPAFALDNVIAPSEGTDMAFFWDTGVDLAHEEHDVKLRLTAVDHDELGVILEFGAPLETAVFRVDNNQEPIAELKTDALFVNSDRRRGIPISYQISDAENDAVQLVIQWRRELEAFPTLPSDPAAVAAILADPLQRKLHRIASPFPVAHEGWIDLRDASSVRLPELASTAASLLARDFVGLELEILRGATPPQPIASTWTKNPLSNPLAVLPLQGGLEAAVLDRPAQAAWRLYRMRLATGEVLAEIASGVGVADSIALERGERTLLLATHAADHWDVTRVDLQSGAITPLVSAAVSTELGQVRGLLSLGTDAALITVDDALVRLDYTVSSAPRAQTLIDGLKTPSGMVLDPLRVNRLYLAEYDGDSPNVMGGGRVLVVELDTLRATSLVTSIHDPLEAEFPHPRLLAIDRLGSRLVALTDTSGSESELRAVELGGASHNEVFTLQRSLPPGVSSFVLTLDDLSVLCAPNTDDVLVGGGSIQRREITGYDPRTQVVLVAPPFDPVPQPLDRWRIVQPFAPNSGAAAGPRGAFVWDSSDSPSTGRVFLKATPIDSEPGVPSESGVAFALKTAWDESPLKLGGLSITSAIVDLSAADMDSDGDMDLICNSLTDDDTRGVHIFFQESPRVFDPVPLQVGGTVQPYECLSFAAVDLDSDGDLDLASGSVAGNKLVLFFQDSPGVFSSAPLELVHPSIAYPRWIAPADLDGDGDQDLAVANTESQLLTLFFQESPGVFQSTPTLLDAPGGPFTLVAADVDGDGDIELASANRYGDILTVFFQSIPGVFDPIPLFLGDSTTTPEPTWIGLGDVDQDGDFDILSSNLGNDSVAIFSQQVAGTFDPGPRIIIDQAAASSFYGAFPADLDADGDFELVSTSTTFTIFGQVAPGEFDATASFVREGSPALAVFGFVVADIDGDGHIDLACTDDFEDDISVFFHAGSSRLDLASVGSVSGIWEVGDLDRDGDLDLVTAGPNDVNVVLAFQTTAGVFENHVLPLPDDITIIEALADIDGDGDLDLVSSNQFQQKLIDTLTVFFQREPGVFDLEPLVLGGTGISSAPQDVLAVDLDRDGDLDLASPNAASENVTVFFQTSPGVFDTAPLTLGDSEKTPFARALAAADLDGDGDQDLAVANGDRHNLSVFFQSSPGVFDPVPLEIGSSAASDGAARVVPADIDGDGDLDLVAANSTGGTVSIYHQTSPGVFATPATYIGDDSTTNTVDSLIAADLDRDGDLDLVCASFTTHVMAIFFQTRPGVFDLQPRVIPAAWAVVGATDLDGDGDVDIVCENGIFWGQH